MKPLLETLPPTTLDTLITWCHTAKYIEVSQRAAKPLSEGGLDLRISPSTLNRLYTTHNIADSKETRAGYAAALGLAARKLRLQQATRENLEQRLFELTARPDATVAELRLAAQFLTRCDSLSISNRRVQVAERRETRIAKLTEPPKADTLEEADRKIHALLGKEFGKDPEPTYQQFQSISETLLTSQFTEPFETKTHSYNPAPESPKPPIISINPILPIDPTPAPAPIPVPPNPPSPPIPAHILAHAERSYPSHLRPNCPINGPQWDWAKNHCIQSRLKFEKTKLT
jgi:hypothetical protein